jgi:PST family polysaccharide transporter
MIGLFVVAKPFILTLFGDKWAEVIPVLQVLCVTGTIQSVGTTTGWIYISQGRTRLMFRWGLSAGALFAMAMIIGLRWGILGVAWSYTICNILLLYPAWAIPGRLINLSFLSMVRNVMGTFVCGLAMGAVVWSSGVIVPPSWPNGAILFVQVSLGIAVYCLLIHLFRLKPYRDAREIVWDRIKGARTL